MEEKKVCFVITKSEVGGAQKWVKEQIDILKENGFDCFICTNQEGWLTQNSLAKGIITDLRIEQRVSIGLVKKLNCFVKKENIDLLIGNSANGGIYSRLSAFLTSRECIYVSHGWSSVYNGGKLTFVYNWIERFLSSITSKILCVSTNDYKIASQIVGIPEEKLEVVTNKIFPVCSPKLNENIHENISSTTRILFLGRLAHPKNPVPLIKAIQGNSSFQLDIVGSGSEINSISKFINDRDIQNVNVLGEIRGFSSFNKYDIFALISESEGLPMSAVEALSCGLPILISDVGGCPEVVKDNGYLTDNTPFDVLKGLYTIKENHDQFSKNSKKLFAEKFDLSKNYQEYVRFYKHLLD